MYFFSGVLFICVSLLSILCWKSLPCFTLFLTFYIPQVRKFSNSFSLLKHFLIHVFERERERGEKYWFCHSTRSRIYWLADSCMCSSWESNLPPWHIGTMLQPTEPPGQGSNSFSYSTFSLISHMCNDLLGPWIEAFPSQTIHTGIQQTHFPFIIQTLLFPTKCQSKTPIAFKMSCQSLGLLMVWTLPISVASAAVLHRPPSAPARQATPPNSTPMLLYEPWAHPQLSCALISWLADSSIKT